ncbi:uncharacterized protein LOC141655548 [Silene latifolia]|uniref:uncharacterized protein LOC141655548 n=1 Tax=Silene latifolia TaxID=37657 RepID=UPI003D774949
MDAFTNAISEMNVRTSNRGSLTIQMLEYQRERDAARAKQKEDDRQWQLYMFLLGKTHLQPVEQVTLDNLKEKFFQQTPNGSGRFGASSIQKCTAALRMLAYGISADQVDEYFKIGATTARQCFVHFVDGIINQFSNQYLQKASTSDVERLLREGERREFSDGIYSKWATLISAISLPQTAKQRLFTKHQASIRKDVERAFGVLQARLAIIRHPTQAWTESLLWKTMMACIIMHNMIVEDERDTYQNYQDPSEFFNNQTENIPGSSEENSNASFNVRPGRFGDLSLRNYMQVENEIRDRKTHISLKNDLVEHVWNNVRRSNSE